MNIFLASKMISRKNQASSIILGINAYTLYLYRINIIEISMVFSIYSVESALAFNFLFLIFFT